jgi:MATE family multidrug resistance protein
LNQYTREFKTNIKIAFPVILGLLGHTVVQMIDNIMVGQLGTTELAAVSLGNSFFFIAMSLGIGFSTALTPLVAQADGSSDLKRVGQIFVHGFFLCTLLGLLLFLAVYLSRNQMFRMGQPEDVVFLAFPYLNWVAVSLIPMIMFQAFRQFSDGLSLTRPAMYATLVANGINVILNYLLIFGHFGFPKLGVEGAAIGTLISRITMLIYIVLYVKYKKQYQKYVLTLKFSQMKLFLIKKIFKLGLPSALQMFFEIAFFVVAVWMSGLLGTNSQAANQITLNLTSMTFMVAMGLGATAMIRVGNQFGKKDYLELKRVAFSVFLLIIIIDVFFCAFYLIFNTELPWIYLDNNGIQTSSDTLQVVAIASSLLIISGFFQITDGLQVVVLGALRGLQDVNIPTTLIFISYWLIGFPVSYYLAFYTPFKATGIWIGLLTGLSCSAILLFLRFKFKTDKLIIN